MGAPAPPHVADGTLEGVGYGAGLAAGRPLQTRTQTAAHVGQLPQVGGPITA